MFKHELQKKYYRNFMFELKMIPFPYRATQCSDTCGTLRRENYAAVNLTTKFNAKSDQERHELRTLVPQAESTAEKRKN